jgi:signal transduction histidine kinase
VAAHAEPSRVEMRAQRDGNRVSLSIEDDGRGFDPGGDRPEGHFGLSLMEDTTRDAGAELAIESRPDEGTRVRVQLEARRR